MKWTIIMDIPEHDTKFGHYEAEQKVFEIPYEPHETVWYCYKKGKKYVVRESMVFEVWATNMVGVRLDNNWCVSECEFDRLFKTKDEAIDFCLKANERSKVKVYYSSRW